MEMILSFFQMSHCVQSMIRVIASFLNIPLLFLSLNCNYFS